MRGEKLCVDCAHHRGVDPPPLMMATQFPVIHAGPPPQLHVCLVRRSLVTGEPEQTPCAVMRASSTACGPDGALFLAASTPSREGGAA